MSDDFQATTLAFLTWLDALERIDTLILEMRHVQETIASQLRLPIGANGQAVRPDLLYDVFDYEDYYLWGTFSNNFSMDANAPPETIRVRAAKGLSATKDWSIALKGLPTLADGTYVLATLWCPEFYAASLAPLETEQLMNQFGDQYTSWVNVAALRARLDEWKRCRAEVTKSNVFSAIDERLYEVMCYLQVQKRELLRDKLVLARRALDAFDTTPNEGREDLLVLFLILRRTVLERLHQRLETFSDILSNVQETLNLSLERDPAPTVRRRRDQGIYTTDLADSCHRIAGDIQSYFAWLQDQPGSVAGYLNVDDQIDYIVHRYTRVHTSATRYDKAVERPWETRVPGRSPTKPRRSVRAGFVRSSFWMPERPDLQPIIAHEIAHLLIAHYFDNLEPITLDGLSDLLSRLLQQIAHIMEKYSERFRYFDFNPSVRREFLLECAVDLVSVSVHRTAYIFAHFMELICSEVEDLFIGHDIADSVAQLAYDNVTFMRQNPPEWFLRIEVALTFSAALAAADEAPFIVLTKAVHDGARALLRRTREQLSKWMDSDQKEDWMTWLEMTNAIAEVVEKSRLVRETRGWQTERKKECAAQAAARLERVPLSRHLPPLATEAKEHCLGAWLDRVAERPRKLGQYLARHVSPANVCYEDLMRAFRLIYFRSAPANYEIETELFGHLIDISWQCATLTVQDFFDDPESTIPGVTGIPRGEWITAAHELNWLGRDLYHTALEFVVWFERPAIGRLKAAYRWLGTLIRDMETALDRISTPSDRAEAERILQILQACAGMICDGTENLPPSAVLATVGEKWTGTLSLRDIRNIRAVGIRWLCDRYPNRTDPDYGHPETIQRWTHIFDFISAHVMDQAAQLIHQALMEVSENSSTQASDQFLARLNPESPADDSLRGLASILETWIRLGHYLKVKPEIQRSVNFYYNRPRLHYRESVNFNKVFSDYLNVPVANRKCAGNATLPIDKLVPSRSFRIDRISLTYERPGDDEEGDTRETIWRDDPNKVLQPTAATFWLPWGIDGRVYSWGAQVPLVQQALAPGLLGRFDRIILEPAKHTARKRQFRATIPFFRRQQTGIPFAAKVRRCTSPVASDGVTDQLSAYIGESPYPPLLHQGDIPRNGSIKQSARRIPIATINILLSQRSARLTFVERLIAEDIVMSSYNTNWYSPYRHFHPAGDVGLLTDGWGDIFLMLFCDVGTKFKGTFSDYVERCDRIEARLREVLTLRTALFNDPLVIRSETSYTAVPIDAALLNPDKYQSTMLVRFRSTLDGTPLAEKFEYGVLHELEAAGLNDVLRVSRISGRTDYAITSQRMGRDAARGAYERLMNQLEYRVDEMLPYGVLFQSLRHMLFQRALGDEMGCYIDSTSTLISDEVGHA